MGRIHGKLRGGGVMPGGYQTPRQEFVDDLFRLRAGDAGPQESLRELLKYDGSRVAARAIQKLPGRVQGRVLESLPSRARERILGYY